MHPDQLLLGSPVETYTQREWNAWLRRVNHVFTLYAPVPPAQQPLFVEQLYEKAWRESKRRGEQLTLFA